MVQDRASLGTARQAYDSALDPLQLALDEVQREQAEALNELAAVRQELKEARRRLQDAQQLLATPKTEYRSVKNYRLPSQLRDGIEDVRHNSPSEPEPSQQHKHPQRASTLPASPSQIVDHDHEVIYIDSDPNDIGPTLTPLSPPL